MNAASRFHENADQPARRPAPTWAILVLPAVAVAAVYLWLPRARIETRIASLRADAASARASSPSPAIEAQETSRALDLRDRVEELRAVSKAGSPSVRADTGPAAHARRAANVTRALARHGLALVEDVAALEAGEEAARRLQGLHASEIRATGAPARAVRFEGSYFAALTALREITGPEVEALPLHLELVRSTDGRTLAWRLVWI